MYGVFIGLVDLVPGISGGTLAFAFGIWDRLLHVVSQLLNALKMLLSLQFVEATKAVRSVDWFLVLPVGFGVLAALFVGANVIGQLFDDHEELMRSFFLGMVIGGVALPFRSIEHFSRACFICMLLGAAISFSLAGLPPTEIEDPAFWLIFLAATVSVCATIVPGLSGSFLLLVFGLYEVFIDSLRERDIFVWLMFASGAWVGTMTFAHLIRWLLTRYWDLVISVLLGLMLGGLRTLWPWLSPEREMQWVRDYSELVFPVLCAIIGLFISLFLARLSRTNEINRS